MAQFKFNLHDEVCFQDGATIILGRVIAREETTMRYTILTQHGLKSKKQDDLANPHSYELESVVNTAIIALRATV